MNLHPKYTRKTLNALSPKDYATTAPTTSEAQKIDTLGFRWATFILNVGTITGTSLDWKISESSDNFSSDTAADVTSATGTQLTGASDNTTHVIVVDCSKTERYLQMTFSASSITAMNLSGICILSNPIDSPYVGTGGVDAKVEAAV